MYQLPNSGKTLSPHLILLQLVSFISVLPGMPAAWITNPAEYVDPELSEGQEDDGWETDALVLADHVMQQKGPVDEHAKDGFGVSPPGRCGTASIKMEYEQR